MANPLCGCILIGGKSLRMGQPKQLIVQNGKTWFEIIYQQLASVCQKVIVVGDGALPPGEWHRVSDDETCNGPLAGLLAAMKTNDQANFIVCSCDIPNINDEAVEWLLRQIEPDVWAVLPSIKRNFIEPLFAYYDHRMFSGLQDLVNDEKYKLSNISFHEKAKIVQPPVHLYHAWKNCNTPSDLPTG